MSIVAEQQNPSLPHGFESAVQRTLQPGRLVRARARLRAGALDRDLIAGADPSARAALAARAAQLSSRRSRRELAAALDRRLAAARGPHRRWWALGRHDAVLANADGLVALARLLDSDTPVYARGIALLQRTLADGTGPFYGPDARELERRLRAARAALGAD